MKRFVALLLILAVTFSLVIAPSSLAQEEEPITGAGKGTWYFPTYNEFIRKVNAGPKDEIFGERYTHAQVVWIIESMINIIAGEVAACATTENPADCAAKVLNSGVNTGPILAVAGAIDAFQSTRPASGIDYVASTLDSIGIPNAYAQGYGYSKSLLPVQKLWQASRNAAYGLSTIVIVILAFMVMFRAKLSPQAVLTAQSAIPRVIIALLAVTFSYAIAGFMVDIAFLLQGLVGAMFNLGDISSLSPVDLFTNINDGVNMVLSYVLAFIIQSFQGGGVVAKIGFQIPVIMNAIDLIIALVILVLLLIGLFRIFWLLLKTYTVFILYVIAGPFILLFSALTPSGNGLFNWMKALTAHLAVFVSIGLLILLAHVLFYSTGNGFSPGLTSFLEGRGILNPFGIEQLSIAGDSGRFPSGFSFTDLSAIGFFVSLGLMLSIPGIANSMRQFILTGKGMSFDPGEIMAGSGAGAAIGLAASPILSGAKAIKGRGGAATGAAIASQAALWGERRGGRLGGVVKTLAGVQPKGGQSGGSSMTGALGTSDAVGKADQTKDNAPKRG